MSDPSTTAGEQPQETPSQGEQIRQALREAINAGKDLTIKDVKVKVQHEIADKLKVNFASVSKWTPKVLSEFGKAPPKPTSVKSATGGASVDVKIPPRQPAKEDQPAAGQQQQSAGQPVASERPQLPYKTLDDLRASAEYQMLVLDYQSAFMEVRELERAFGLEVPQPFVVQVNGKDQVYDPIVLLADKWAIAHIKYGWTFPQWLEKTMLMGTTAACFLVPVLAQFGLIGGDGKEKRKDDNKKEPEKSDKPLKADLSDKEKERLR